MPDHVLTPPLANRARQRDPVLIVLHATAGSTVRSSVAHLRGIGLGYHVIITRDGKDSAKSANADGSAPVVVRCVPLDRVTFHTGSTIPVPGAGSINGSSVGISLANIQRTTDPEPYPAAQMAALDQVIASAMQELGSITLITTHAIVQPWNRADPRGVDVDAIATRHGLKVWRPTAAEIAAHTPKKAPIG